MLLIFKKLQSGATVIYYTLNNDFFYTRLAYVFCSPERFLLRSGCSGNYVFPSYVKTWYLFQAFFIVGSFLLQKDFEIFDMLRFGSFVHLFDNIRFALELL